MVIKLNTSDIVNAIKQMSKEEVIMQEVNRHYYDLLTAKENIIKKREALLERLNTWKGTSAKPLKVLFRV